jgi:L-ribulose-5-phosphate 3-epimerase
MQNSFQRFSRREMLRSTTLAAATLALSSRFAPLLAGAKDRRFKIGACDWSIGKMASEESFAVARTIGLDGVQVSLGTAKDDMKLRQPDVQQTFLSAAKQAGVEVASLAIGELNNIPYKSNPRTVPWVNEASSACRAMGARVVLLAFFGNGDLRDDPAGKQEVVRRLTEAAKRAEDAGVILGIESWLSAEEHLEIIDKVGSPAVQVYYDVCNSNDRGYDIYREIRMLGPRICEFHAKENGALLGKGKVDFQKVREAMDDIKYRGWIQIEGAVPPGAPMLESYQANNKFLRKTFV